MGAWIRVEDRLPQDKIRYLVATHGAYSNELYADVFYYCGNGAWDCDDGSDYDSIRNVTHWMPLPEPPKEGANNDKR